VSLNLGGDVKLVALALLALSTAAAAPVQHAPPVKEAPAIEQAKRDARASAEAWLKLSDAGLVDASWDELATGMKKDVSREQWRLIMARMRFGAGNVTARAIWKTVYTDKLLGAPPGTYVTVLYRSQFSKRGAGVENIPVALDADGKWRVCGYHADSPEWYVPAK